MFNCTACRVPRSAPIPIAFSTLLLFACGDSTPAPTAIEPKRLSYEGLTPPTTIAELLTSLKIIAQRRLWDRDDFYTETTLKRLFGAQAITATTDPGERMTIELFGFRDLLKPYPTDLSGVEMFALKRVKRLPLPDVRGAAQMSDYNTQRVFRAILHGSATGLDFNTVVGIFGADWKENRQAENEIFMAITREPFNPPPPKPTGFMGDAIITYTMGDTGDKQDLSLRFDGEGTLREIDSATLYEGR